MISHQGFSGGNSGGLVCGILLGGQRHGHRFYFHESGRGHVPDDCNLVAFGSEDDRNRAGFGDNRFAIVRPLLCASKS